MRRHAEGHSRFGGDLGSHLRSSGPRSRSCRRAGPSWPSRRPWGWRRMSALLMPALTPDQLVVDLARVDRALDELGGVDSFQIQQCAASAVLGDVGHVHLNDVGSRAAGGLGGQLVPVAAELTRLGRDLHIGVGLHVRGDHRFGVLVARRVAPPGQGQGRGAVSPPPPPPPPPPTEPGAQAVSPPVVAAAASPPAPRRNCLRLMAIAHPFAIDVKAFSAAYGELRHSVNAGAERRDQTERLRVDGARS